MFEGQPKGLYALALANTGERFGYYTMLAIFTLFLQAKFGYTAAETSCSTEKAGKLQRSAGACSWIYSIFYGAWKRSAG